jgi:transposase
MAGAADHLPDDSDALKAALIETRAKLVGAQAVIEHLQLVIAKMQREKFGPRSEKSQRLIDQLELQLEEVAAAAAEDAAKATGETGAERVEVQGFTRRKATRRDFPADLPRRRIVHPAPTACPCCGGNKLSKIGEDVTETLDVVPRQWFVTEHVREKFSCRSCEAITQPPAPFHAIARGFAGPSLLAMMLVEKYANHQPLNRQSEQYAREGIALSVSTMADHVGACTATLMPLYEIIKAHVFAAERIHGDDTTVPVLAKTKCRTGRIWTYVRDDRPFGGEAPPAAVFFYSPDRAGIHPEQHLAGYCAVHAAIDKSARERHSAAAPPRKPKCPAQRLPQQSIASAPGSTVAAARGQTAPQLGSSHRLLHQCKRQCLHRAKSARRPLSEDYRSTSVAAVAIGTSTTEHITKPAKRASLSPSSLDSRSPALLLPRSPEISVNDKIRATGRMLTKNLMTSHVLAIDQGTTSSRAIVFRADCTIAGIAQQEIPQHFPQSGWVEHDPEDLWRTVLATGREAIATHRQPVRGGLKGRSGGGRRIRPGSSRPGQSSGHKRRLGRSPHLSPSRSSAASRQIAAWRAASRHRTVWRTPRRRR